MRWVIIYTVFIDNSQVTTSVRTWEDKNLDQQHDALFTKPWTKIRWSFAGHWQTCASLSPSILSPDAIFSPPPSLCHPLPTKWDRLLALNFQLTEQIIFLRLCRIFRAQNLESFRCWIVQKVDCVSIESFRKWIMQKLDCEEIWLCRNLIVKELDCNLVQKLDHAIIASCKNCIVQKLNRAEFGSHIDWVADISWT